MEPLALPWRRRDEDTLKRLTKCTADNDTFAGKNHCLMQITNHARILYRTVWESDQHSYTQNHASDFLVKPVPKVEKE